MFPRTVASAQTYFLQVNVNVYCETGLAWQYANFMIHNLEGIILERAAVSLKSEKNEHANLDLQF